jgi:hypothetical protein
MDDAVAEAFLQKIFCGQPFGLHLINNLARAPGYALMANLCSSAATLHFPE